ncbi:MAG: tetratricopeptide repeat protein [Candidatus Omnitrophota bacterium]
MENKAGNRLAFLRTAMVIAAVTAAVYAGSLGNSFVWDDAVVIEKNDFTRSWKNLPLLFSRAYLTPSGDIGSKDFYSGSGSGETSYRPVTTATYFLDYHFWKLSVFGYHLTNLLLHIINAVLLFVFVWAITSNRMAGLFAGLLFAVHPVNAEAVGIISFREDLLAFLFYLSSLLFYIKAATALSRKGRILLYGFSLSSFLFALFSKEMAVTLPFLLVLYDYFFGSGKNLKALWVNFRSRYIWYFLAALFYLFTAFFVIGGGAPIPAVSAGAGIFSRLPAIPKIFAVYLQWLLWPFNVHVTLPEYPLFVARSVFEPAALFSAVLLAALFVAAIKIRKIAPVISFAALWFFLALLPVSNIIPLMNHIACRYLYIPSAGFCLLAAAALCRMKKNAVYAGFLILALFSALTFIRNSVWKNNIALWSEMAQYYPQNAVAHSGLAGALKKAGRLEEAIKEYKLALQFDPDYANDHNNLGSCYYAKLMFTEAIIEFQKALELDPGLLAAYSNLGSALGERGLYAAAAVYFNRALDIDRKYTPAYNGLGVTYARLGKFETARMIWQQALRIKPDDTVIRDNLFKLSQIMPDDDNAEGEIPYVDAR